MIFRLLFGTRKSLAEWKLDHQMERDARLDPQHLGDEIADIEEQIAEILPSWEKLSKSGISPESLEEQRRELHMRKNGLEKRLTNLTALRQKHAK